MGPKRKVPTAVQSSLCGDVSLPCTRTYHSTLPVCDTLQCKRTAIQPLHSSHPSLMSSVHALQRVHSPPLGHLQARAVPGSQPVTQTRRGQLPGRGGEGTGTAWCRVGLRPMLTARCWSRAAPVVPTGCRGMQSGSQALSGSANVFSAFLFLQWSSKQQLQRLCLRLMGKGSQPLFFLSTKQHSYPRNQNSGSLNQQRLQTNPETQSLRFPKGTQTPETTRPMQQPENWSCWEHG